MRKRLGRREIQLGELEIALDFQKFCEEHDLRFYLAGGTLLGAIRHKGFIPWDDDIDLCMPRPDYEKLISVYPENDEKYTLRSWKRGNFRAPFVKIVDLSTNIISKYATGETDRYLWIDIFPVDGLPPKLEDVSEIYKTGDRYRTILGLVDSRLGEGTTVFRKYAKYVLKPFAKFYGKGRCVNRLETLAARHPYESSEYVGAVTWGLYGVGERMKKSEFEKSVDVEFEGHKFPAMSCWDSYLHGIYGDYMQLPPVEKRKTHDMEVWVEEMEAEAEARAKRGGTKVESHLENKTGRRENKSVRGGYEENL